jgi:hypothetical protein
MGSIMNLDHDFSKEVEELTRTKKNGKYIETIIDLCEKYGIEPESAAKLLSKPIREKLKTEFESLNMVRGKRKTSKLPLD